MTDARALRIICEAALLNDKEAADFLLAHLDTLSGSNYAQSELIHALGWVDAEKAIAYSEATGSIMLWLHNDLIRLKEAQRFCAESEETQESHRVIIALLPPESPELRERTRILRLATAMQSCLDFLSRSGWQQDMETFLAARLWHHCPERFWEAIQAYERFDLGG